MSSAEYWECAVPCGGNPLTRWLSSFFLFNVIVSMMLVEMCFRVCDDNCFFKEWVLQDGFGLHIMHNALLLTMKSSYQGLDLMGRDYPSFHGMEHVSIPALSGTWHGECPEMQWLGCWEDCRKVTCANILRNVLLGHDSWSSNCYIFFVKLDCATL